MAIIIVKAPLRIAIGGGGTDLPSYYEQFGSTFISAAIDKYVYISIHKIFLEKLIVKYSEMEWVDSVQDIVHPIVRECLLRTGVQSGVEICSFADIPAGTGLGSSSTFTVALLKALYTYTRQFHNNLDLAEAACDVEINKLGSPIGKQDQYISAIGGITRFDIDTSGKVSAKPLALAPAVRTDLEEHILLFFTGFARSANEILLEQDQQTKKEAANQQSKSPAGKDSSPSMIENLHFVKELGLQIGSALVDGDLNEFARLMNVHWEHKKQRSKSMSKREIDGWYDLALKNGALGGKLIGAGGGGFLMFLAEDKRRLRRAMAEAGLHDVPFRFDDLGARVIMNG